MKTKDKKSSAPTQSHSAQTPRYRKVVHGQLHLHCTTNERGMIVLSSKSNALFKTPHS